MSLLTGAMSSEARSDTASSEQTRRGEATFIVGGDRKVFDACADAVLALGAEPVVGDDRAYFEWMTVADCDGRIQELRGVSVMLVEDGRIVRQTDYPHPLAPSGAFERTSVAVGAVEDNVAWGE